MPKQDSQTFDYVETVDAQGNRQKSLTVKLYASDGSIMYLPQGRNPAYYSSKGYIFKRTPEWEEKHKKWLEDREASLRISNFQREKKERELEIQRKRAEIEMKNAMAEEERRLKEELDALDAEVNAASKELDSTLSGDAPDTQTKPKAKAKTKAKAS